MGKEGSVRRFYHDSDNFFVHFFLRIYRNFTCMSVLILLEQLGIVLTKIFTIHKSHQEYIAWLANFFQEPLDKYFKNV